MAPPIYKHHLNYNTKTTPVTKNRIGKAPGKKFTTKTDSCDTSKKLSRKLMTKM